MGSNIKNIVTFFDDNSRSKIICNTAIGAMLVIVAYVIMISAHWTLGDDLQLINTTGVGKTFTFWIGRGRFPPIGNFDFNILNYIPYGYSVNAHFMLNVTCFTLTVLTLAVLLNNNDKGKAGNRYINTLFLISSPLLLGYITVFVDVIYPERLMCLTLALFMLCYKKALESKKTVYYVLAFLLAAYTTYCKEPIFGAFLVIAVANLLFNGKEMDKKERIFYFSLIFNAVVFILLWYFLGYKHDSYSLYGTEKNIIYPFYIRIIRILIKCTLLIPAFLLGGVRIYKIIFKKDKTMLYYDSLLFAGMAYTCAMLCFQFTVAKYYYIPAFILVLPSFVHWVNSLFKHKQKKLFISMILFCLIATTYMSKNAIDSVIDHYKRSITLTENTQKMNWFLPENRRIIWLDGYYNGDIQFVEDFLNYLNTKDLGKKPFIADSDITKKYTDAIKIANIDDEIDPQTVYISFHNDLPEWDKRFVNFVPIFEIDSWRVIFTAYAFKEE